MDITVIVAFGVGVLLGTIGGCIGTLILDRM